jgi:hypothetical protein
VVDALRHLLSLSFPKLHSHVSFCLQCAESAIRWYQKLSSAEARGSSLSGTVLADLFAVRKYSAFGPNATRTVCLFSPFGSVQVNCSKSVNTMRENGKGKNGSAQGTTCSPA